MQLRIIDDKEVPRLKPCLAALAAHRNSVSLHFQGTYPSRPYEQTLELFSAALAQGRSQIAVLEERSSILGFCKVDLAAGSGKIDDLIVLPEHRGRGCGKLLMDWAMQVFRQAGVQSVEVKVVAGNDAIRPYETCGFRLNAQLLRLGP